MPLSESANHSLHAVTKLLLSSQSHAELRVCNTMATLMAWVTLAVGNADFERQVVFEHTQMDFWPVCTVTEVAEGLWNDTHFRVSVMD